ncbi:MAG: VPS9 domain-containing protein, partial [archaeon]|nr:VPS9 domain-containing protein [archaeon]
MEKTNLEKLLSLEKNFRNRGQSQNCLETCLKIIKEIESDSASSQYSILSKILLHKNQSLCVIFGIYKEIIKNTNLLKDKDSEKLYLTLLEQSLNKNKTEDNIYKEHQRNILQLFLRSDLNYKQIENEIMKINILNDNNINSPNINTSVIASNGNILRNSLGQSDISNEGKSMIELKTVDSQIKSSEKKNFKINSNLPYIIISINATLNSDQLIAIIKKIFKDSKYKQIHFIQKNQSEMGFVFEKSQNKFFNFCCCGKKNIIQLSVSILLIEKLNLRSENKYERKISIRSIQGPENLIEIMIVSFIKQILPKLTKLQILKKSKTLSSYNFEDYISGYFKKQKIFLFKSKNIVYDENTLSYSLSEDHKDLCLIDVEKEDVFKSYDVYKILSQDSYSLGKSVNEFLNKFKDKYSSHKELSPRNIKTKEIMNELTEEIAECLQTFLNSFNLSENINDNNEKENLREIIEQYIFNKVYYLMMEIYQKKYFEEDKLFKEKQKEINQNTSVDELFKFLEIKKKFRGTDLIPFKISIELLNKLEFEQIPKKKFEILTQSNLELRNTILDISKGKLELDSMDDELPIIIYIATQIKTNYIIAQLNFIDDYLKCTLKDDLFQNKMITNLLSSITYISNK